MRRNVPVLAALVAATAFGGSGLAAQESPVGVWNIRSNDLTARATGGVRVVLLRVEQAGRDYDAEMTSIRNTFAPVDEFEYDDGEMQVTFGSYVYTLEIDGDRVTGKLESPLGTQEIEGQRQSRTLMYVGDEGIDFRTTRTGVLGLATEAGPPTDAPDPHAWVTSRARTLDDLALLNGRARVPVRFTNAQEFERQLRELAGARVTIVGVWEGERIRIESIERAAS
jgi:hypothetical protein